MNYPSISSFPNDQQLRVVWGFGPLRVSLNLSTAPHFLVSLRSVTGNNSLSENEKVYEIPLAQADIVRLGSIWLGQRRVEGFWEQYAKTYSSSVFFNFDFIKSPPSSIAPSEKDPSTGTYQVPPSTYSCALGTKKKVNNKLEKDKKSKRLNEKGLSEKELKDLKRQAVFLGQMLKSNLTKLISTDEYIVLIPSIEFLTSCYTPKEQQLRNKIVNLKLDDALADYLDTKDSCENELGEYDLYMKSVKHVTNLAFLGYAQCNDISRKRLEVLRNSLSTVNKDKFGQNYPDRYPEVLPYHPDGMQLSCGGVWVGGQTFLVLRVNGYSLPLEYKINQVLLETVFTGDDSDPEHGVGENNGGRSQLGVITDNLQNVPVIPGLDPNINTAGANITNEVVVLGAQPDVENFVETIETDIKRKNKNRVERQKPRGLSSGDVNSSKDSEGVGQLKQSEKDGVTDCINQLEILETISKALQFLLSSGKVEKLEFLDSFANSSSIPSYASFPAKLIGHEDSHSWVVYFKYKDGKVVTRSFLLVKVTMTDGKVLFLFEIQRKHVGEGFSGLIFETDGGVLSSKERYRFLLKVVEHQGKFRRRVKDSSKADKDGNRIALERKELPDFINNPVIFDHRKGLKSWDEKILSELLGYSRKALLQR